jgi:hypothetical protein
MKFALEQAMKAQRYSSTLSLTSALDGVRGVVSDTTRPFYLRKRDPLSIVQGTGRASGPVQTGAECLAPTRISSPYRPASS